MNLIKGFAAAVVLSLPACALQRLRRASGARVRDGMRRFGIGLGAGGAKARAKRGGGERGSTAERGAHRGYYSCELFDMIVSRYGLIMS